MICADVRNSAATCFLLALAHAEERKRCFEKKKVSTELPAMTLGKACKKRTAHFGETVRRPWTGPTGKRAKEEVQRSGVRDSKTDVPARR